MAYLVALFIAVTPPLGTLARRANPCRSQPPGYPSLFVPLLEFAQRFLVDPGHVIFQRLWFA